MLHNILLSAGLYNEVNKQGKFINVVLAAGEIEARIRLLDETVMQTKLISGMSFPIPTGFKSVAFLSETTQQTKVWLGDLPLTYSTDQKKTVGSSALVSDSRKVLYGDAHELLPAAHGRGNVTISALEDINIGGVNLSPANAITVKAGTNFNISTQGAIYAYSDNIANTSVNTIRPTDNVFNYQGSFDAGGGVFVADKSGVGIVAQGGSFTRFSLVTEQVLSVVSTGLGSIANYSNQSNETLVNYDSKCWTIVSHNAKTALISVDFSTGELKEKLLVSSGGDLLDYHIDFSSDSVAALIVRSNHRYILTGSTSALTEQQVPDFGAFDARTVSVFNNVLRVIGLQHYIESTDGGVTFSAIKANGLNISYGSGVKHDVTTGYYYAMTNDQKLYRSVDAQTWSFVRDFPHNIYEFYCLGGKIYAAGERYFFYSADNANSFVQTDINSIASVSESTIHSFSIADDVMYLKSSNGNLYRFGGEIERVGGLDVAIMSEVN